MGLMLTLEVHHVNTEQGPFVAQTMGVEMRR